MTKLVPLLAEIPAWVPKVVGFWGDGGEYRSGDGRRHWLLSKMAESRLQRLFAVTCAYKSLPFYESKYPDDLRVRSAIEAAELFADGRLEAVEMEKARAGGGAAADAAYAAYFASAADAAYAASAADAADAAYAASAASAAYAAYAASAASSAERLNQSRILTLLISSGDWSAQWSTSTVRGLADGIYWDRAWGNLPILADALEEAGCDNLFALRVCRELPSECCFRGLWVVDMSLNLRGV